VELLCDDDKKKEEAHKAVIEALQARIALWNSIIA
jgi:hypothetical protein